LAGVVVSALVFAWKNALRIRARKYIDDKGVKHYEIFGPLFFGSTTLFMSKFEVESDPNEVIIDFEESRIMDQSAIEAVNKLAEKYQKAGKEIHLRHLSADCIKMIKKAEKICDINVLEDPDYYIAVNNYKKTLTKVLGSDAAGEVGELDKEGVQALAQAGKAVRRSPN
jgi:SulP family sulfate permease